MIKWFIEAVCDSVYSSHLATQNSHPLLHTHRLKNQRWMVSYKYFSDTTKDCGTVKAWPQSSTNWKETLNKMYLAFFIKPMTSVTSIPFQENSINLSNWLLLFWNLSSLPENRNECLLTFQTSCIWNCTVNRGIVCYSDSKMPKNNN